MNTISNTAYTLLGSIVISNHTILVEIMGIAYVWLE